MAEARRTDTPHAQSQFRLRTRCQRTPRQLAPLPVDTAAHTSSRAGCGPAARQRCPASQDSYHPVPLFQSCKLFTSRARQRRMHANSPARPRRVSSIAPGAEGCNGHHGDTRALVSHIPTHRPFEARLHAWLGTPAERVRARRVRVTPKAPAARAQRARDLARKTRSGGAAGRGSARAGHAVRRRPPRPAAAPGPGDSALVRARLGARRPAGAPPGRALLRARLGAPGVQRERLRARQRARQPCRAQAPAQARGRASRDGVRVG
jgi:hypothetical protein